MKHQWLTKVSNAVSTKAGKGWLICKKHSPEIWTGVGILSLGGAIVTACRATLKAEEVLAKHKEKLAEMQQAFEVAKEDPDLEYDEKLYRQDLGIQTAHTGVALAKTYALPVGLTALSVTSFLVAENIINKRYMGAVCAFNAVSEAFQGYRDRVIEEEGEKKDYHYLYGTEYSEETVESVGEDGKKKKEKVEVANTDGNLIKDPSTVIFDESNPNWSSSPGFCKHFILVQQEVANQKLHARGYVFLNEVYEMLGFEPQPYGQLIGWIDGLGDNYIDFGISEQDDPHVRNFINGKESTIMLTFNHDGMIYDKI